MLITDISPKTRALADRLAMVPVAETITYSVLSEVAEADVQARRGLLHSALRIVQREIGAVFATERNIGFRRLTTEEIPDVGGIARSRIRKIARRSSRTIVAGLKGANDVAEAVKLRATAELATLGMVEHLSRDGEVRRRAASDAAPAITDAARDSLSGLGISSP